MGWFYFKQGVEIFFHLDVDACIFGMGEGKGGGGGGGGGGVVCHFKSGSIQYRED